MPKMNDSFYSKLSDQEKMRLIAEIWQSIGAAVVEADAEFIEDIRQSQQEYQANPELAVSWEVMAKRLGW